MDKYEVVKDLGFGNFGVARLMRNKETKELVAMKYIPRGKKIDENVAREIINHRSVRHPNIIRFKEVVLTPTHLVIIMEYAGGGELFERICNAGRFSEDEARYFFQQLISGVSYCHFIKYRDLKLEHSFGWKSCAAAQNLRLRLLQVVAASLEAEVNGRHASVHRTGGSLSPGIRRQRDLQMSGPVE